MLVAWENDPIAVETLAPGQSFSLEHVFGGIAAAAQALHVGETDTLVRGKFEISIARIAIDAKWRPAAFGFVAVLSASMAALLCVLAIFIERATLFIAPEIAFGEPVLHVSLQPRRVTLAEHELSEPIPEVVAEPTSELEDFAGSARCGDAEMGRPDSIANGRYGVDGTPDNPDPHIARMQGAAKEPLPFDAPARVSASGPDPDAPSAPWGRDDALGNDPLSRRGQLWAERIADARGDAGLGLQRIVGGLAKRIEWAPLAEPRATPRVLHTGLVVHGVLRPSAIARAMATRFGSFESCYHARLREAAALGGRVLVRFELGESGLIGEPRIESSELRDLTLFACLGDALKRTSLPRSEHGTTSVAYPLFLISGAATARAGSAAHPSQNMRRHRTASSCGQCARSANTRH